MPFPSNWILVPITGQYEDAQGNPQAGTIYFRTPQIVTIDDIIIVPTVFSAALDSTGSLTLDLPATDDPHVSPTGWAYAVEEDLTDGSGREFSIFVPSASPGLDMATISPVTPPPTLVGYVTEAPVDGKPYVRESAGWVVNGSGGTVTSVDTGPGLTGGPITSSGTIALDDASIVSLASANTAVQAVVAGTNVTIDNTNPQKPVVSASGGGGTGTVSSVSVTTANGVSGTVANPTTIPAISLDLGNITPSSVAAIGNVTGSNLSGTNTGDQTSVTGNAGTASRLQTARDISGVPFDGTAPITIPYSGLSGLPTLGTAAAENIGYFATSAQGATADTAVQAVVAGTGVSVDNTNPQKPVVSSTGTGGGTVTSVSVTTANGVSGTVVNPSTTPAITVDLGAITPTSVAASGSVSGSNLSGINTGDQTITLTGDVTGSGTGSFAATLAATAVTAATYGDATHVGQFTVDAKGRITAASSVAITTGGSGTVTSVSVVTANGFAGTVATATSTPAITLTTGVTGILKGNGTAISAAAAADFPTLNQSTTGSAATLTTPRTIGLSGVTATSEAFDGSANITIPVTGVPASLLSGTIAASQMPALTGDVTTVAGTVATTISAGSVTLAKQADFAASSLMGNPTGSIAAPSAITLGSGLAFSGTTLTATGGGTGTVTSVGLALPSIFAVTGSPVTTSGTLAATLGTQSPNAVFAGPSSGSAAAPTFRALVASDLPISPFDDQTGVSYTLALTDAENGVRLTNASAITLSIDKNANVAFPRYTRIPIRQGGAGIITIGIVSGSGVTLISPNGASTTALGDGRVLEQTDIDTWVVW